MIQILSEKSGTVNPEINLYANKKRLAWLQNQIFEEHISATLQHQSVIANEMLNAGYTQQSIDQYNDVLHTIDSLNIAPPESFMTAIKDLLAITHFRHGEETNCLDGHNAESCIMPIRGTGIHRKKSSAENAINIYHSLLANNPNDYVYRWLLNLSYMVKGDYPDRVPDRWLIPQLTPSDSIIFPEFKEIAKSVGLDHVSLAGGSIADDFDGDGLVDIMVSSWGMDNQLHYFKNMGIHGFEDRTQSANLHGITGGLNMVHGDYNNDGWADVFVLRGGWFREDGDQPNSLLKNNGDGTFTDVTLSAKIYSEHPTQTASWGDFNNDGWLDLFIGNESTNDFKHISELYQNNQDGTFTDVAWSLGVNVTGFVKAVVWGDINNDSFLDLYISRLGKPNLLFQNSGPVNNYHFKDISKKAGVTEPINSFPTWFWDFNNDGWEDIWVSGYDNSSGHVAMDYLGLKHEGESPRLYQNNKDGTFTDVTLIANMDHPLLTMGSNFGDLNNDGFLDFYAGTGDPDFRSIQPNRMFLNNKGKSFDDVTFHGRFGHLQKGHGVSFADFDQDGDLDVHTVMGGAYEGSVYQNVLFQNPGGWNNNWVGLSLKGMQTNKLALGARIEVVLETGTSIYRTISSGGSFGGNPFDQMIGIGKANKIKTIHIFWPGSRTTQTLSEIDPNVWYHVTENESIQKNE
ncbi:MAG: CRTAC1 family protein [Candidatus Marinimicrobia bacterium]|nr:CRTAC1 family protein [Candidatus Neomarinimicrobiota bacterium]MBT3675445.1 CRTAC1 family protein [Candidatus Neomarinimicrobiota bacterium]MBT3762516.1 CRTAC1 family protein [Candidatus Neomarinimicrobiota bacterium]MBT4068347.1 CRTAC1 family protein [Candidatus Neomarinimicrobiota bacterium]MBT4269824.1 CRTAC1 family protein [Candidatus Neomarinimicrobiota bacterium]